MQDTTTMSLNTVISSISDLVAATRKDAFNEIKALLMEKFQDDAEVREKILEAMEQQKPQPREVNDIPVVKKIKKKRAPRAPTQYNRFVAEKITELKAKGAKGESRELMKEAVKMWKERKGA